MAVLAYPILVVILAFLSILLFVKGRWFYASGLTLLCLLVNWYSESYAFRDFTSITFDKKAGVLRILTYNVWNESPFFEDANQESVVFVDRLLMLNADILVMNEMYKDKYSSTIDSLACHYRYCTNQISEDRLTGTYIFSNYPISDFNGTRYNDSSSVFNRTWLSTMTISVDGNPVRLYACHLAANQISNLLPDESVPFWEKAKQVYSSMSKAYDKRAVQAEAIRDSLDNCNIPTLVVGDFNDVGGSYTLRHIQGSDMADAWWKGGFGYGATYDMHNLYLRLDHILYSKKDFKVKAVKVLTDWKYSDHYPIVADLELIAK